MIARAAPAARDSLLKRDSMDPWLFLGIWISGLSAIVLARAIRSRLERRERSRHVEMPNSHYASQLVLDIEARQRWHAIPLERVHEINRAEIRRLIAEVERHGIRRLTPRERAFLDRMAELNPPAPRGPRFPPETPAVGDHAWSDPFGFQPPLHSRSGSG
jgi:hypothetical protein